MGRLGKSLRTYVQIAFTALTNGYAAGFTGGKIYQGSLKSICVPGLNCYSCPGAFGSCPIGSLQAVIGSRFFNIPFYVIGFLMVFGAVLGRLVCGWLCPFGLVQDLIYKIPVKKKLKKLPGDKILRHLRYVILLGFVVLLPMFATDIVGQGSPWFCAYICPSGTLFAGIPLLLANSALREAAGFLFQWKLFILAGLLLLSVFVYRPFCRYICPLGAIYGPFNKIALYRLRVDENKCIDCGKCQKACNFDIPVYRNPNSVECIRCGDCRRACPTRAITSTLDRVKEVKPYDK